MREKADYRGNLERLDEKFPNKDLLNASEVSRFTGLDRKRVKAIFKKDFKPYGEREYISKTALARLIS